ncbi:flavin reductase family protein [Neomegalonema sp.]|uniref:flavin reductase family protein n=1 Tax=Neomegalonema sp. TaxID=2039713 RepID=UPI002629F3A0|nr:flavin reductase family protein [Neomegalonema sp.]MDD2868790.1 flavin reductase family protein [Neomegalonema sp.]
MFYRPGRDPHGLPHDPLKACVAPRPIAWVTSLDAAGVVNLAPFSFFAMVSDAPPTLMISCNGRKPGLDEAKDTRRNVEAAGEFVVNMATWDQREAVSLSSAAYAAGTSEAEALGLALAPGREIRTPHLEAAPVALECRLWRMVPLMNPDEAMILGEIVGVHIRDEALTEGHLDLARIKPLARLGYQEYAAVERVFAIPRPRKPQD